MTPEEFYLKMKELQEKYKSDEEYFHLFADKLIIDLLKRLGYSKGIEIFENAEKWYA